MLVVITHVADAQALRGWIHDRYPDSVDVWFDFVDDWIAIRVESANDPTSSLAA